MHTPSPVSALLILLVIAIAGCEKSTGPESASSTIVELPGCRPALSKSASPNDSCFSWQFSGSLSVDFCVLANCCPDSNRFAMSHVTDADSIVVTIADTAANLCKCVCRHWVHAEFQDLALNKYRFLVYLQGSASQKPLYDAVINRN